MGYVKIKGKIMNQRLVEMIKGVADLIRINLGRKIRARVS